ncbi:uncharacterized protein N0V89_009306 [Didymosphaeria variabile]|uniref:RNA binding protein Nrd1 n=1 Tax=Didymosphaeria variabile TaxID=1932322 RepID=A0A9W8XEV8_9PLEO|nr:uncharacterized protein N0V89_009306 [Didymosphaeria variabile]KAJ4347934.1 hypothetical protein N0V89_009306 [Didymosphaeria variabile]
MAAMEELEALLQSLQALKPPGVTATKIKEITQKSVDNVQSDVLIVQKIAQQFKNSPATHKLGVLYVVDSVVRQWLDRAKKTGQAVSRSAAPGTFASGVQKITDILPLIMTDLSQSAPDSQKEKILKLVEIWERGQTFPKDMLAGFKQQFSSPKASKIHAGFSLDPRLRMLTTNFAGAFTATASPSKNLQASHHTNPPTNPPPIAAAAPPATVPPQDPSALLAVLAGLAPQQNNPTNPMSIAAPSLPFPQNAAFPPPPPGFAPPPPPPAHVVNNVQPNGNAAQPGGVTEMAGQILQAMQAGTISQEQGLQVLNMLAAAQNGGLAVPPSQPAITMQAPQIQNGAQPDRFEQNGSRLRDRSRSPDFNRRRQSPRRSPPARRDSPTYGVYDPNAGPEGNAVNRQDRGDRGRGRGRNRGGRNDHNEYRQRTPPPRRGSGGDNSKAYQNGSPKFIDWDRTLPRDHIKVYSRTLFIGGATGTESEIRSIFSQFGKVQSCIVNQEKRHAFVKMLTRPDALAAKAGMDSTQDPNALAKARQTRWGVGFGPRDCSDYNTGVSVIPISRLTDADRKWVLTAEYGGTGGVPLEEGMVIEEPDIEIGAGVSSKAISRRVPPEGGRARGGFRGGRGGGGLEDNNNGFRRAEQRPARHDTRHISPRAEQGVAVPPSVPGFGFQLPFQMG